MRAGRPRVRIDVMRNPTCVFAAVLVLAACGGGMSEEDAVALVRTYNSRVIEAFRTGDARLIDPITGPTDGTRLTGLIGVKTDMGFFLEAKLLELRVLGISRSRDEVTVRTEERWYYLDRRRDTGERIGQDSTDHYFMRYHIRRPEGRWVVDEIAFDKPPEVGRTELPIQLDARTAHGAPQPGDETTRNIVKEIR